MSAPLPAIDEAIDVIVGWLQKQPLLDTPKSRGQRSGMFGCEMQVDLPAIEYLRGALGPGSHVTRNTISMELGCIFFDAAWELARRGVLRPGGILYVGELVDSPLGSSFSLTQFGRQWIAGYVPGQMVPVDPGRFAKLILDFGQRFGEGFRTRATEAAACYRSQMFLATCAMAGAACESMLLAAAIAREGDEAEVLKIYQSSRGRSKLVEKLATGLPAGIAAPIRTAQDLLAYWRDEAAHGLATSLGEFQAHDALSRLLRLSQVVSAGWDTIKHTPRREV